MTKAQEYFQNLNETLSKAQESQAEKVEEAARICADSLAADGYLYTFGTGHSHLLAEEIFYRAGGLVRIFPLEDDALMLHTGASRSSQFERIAGFASILLTSSPAKAGDVIFVFSNSGRNTMPVEMAMKAREMGLKTICITSFAHAATVSSRHESGKKLGEVCDIALDNCGSPGDSCVNLGELQMGPTSTVVGAALLQDIVCRTAELLEERGISPEVFASANVDGGDRKNAAYLAKYKEKINIL